MKRKNVRVALACMMACLLFVPGCRATDEPQSIAGQLPAEPQYADPSQWYVTDRHAAVDLFYVVSTETADYRLGDGSICHFADTYNDSTRSPLHGEMVGVDDLIGGALNYYSPYYRQCSLNVFADKGLLQACRPISSDDVKRAFNYYLSHMNGGRPFVLAGFSQGAMLILDLIKDMDDATSERMVAAYAIGVTITRDEMAANPRIVAAQGAGDTGVTICYNSVRDASCAMPGWDHSDVAINPVNWRTDATPAVLITEPSPLIPLTQQRKDTLTVTLDVPSGLLCVDGYTGSDYLLPLIGKEGCYHSREVWLYRDQLRENIALRASNYLKNNVPH